MSTETHNDEARGQGRPAIVVKVNRKPVTFDEGKATGAEIKAAAIAQGVEIGADFNLFEVKGEAPLDPVADDKLVTLHPNQEFRAVAPDDNS